MPLTDNCLFETVKREMFLRPVFIKLCAEHAYVFNFLNFLAESTFRDIDTVGDPQNACFGL